MFGTSLQFNGVRGEDRFYIPVKARKNQNQNLRKKTQRDKCGENKSEDSATKYELVDSHNRNLNEDSATESELVDSEPASNIDRFLESTTPLVPAQFFSKVDLFLSFIQF